MNDSLSKLYKSYKHKIQKADLARYIILRKYGGIYADFDIKLHTHLDKILSTTKKDFICVVEAMLTDYTHKRTGDYKIRQSLPINEQQEYKTRIANYFITSTSKNIIWKDILYLCANRSNLNMERYIIFCLRQAQMLFQLL